MIQIKMCGEKWRIAIGDELWEFPSLKEMQSNLDTILKIKDKYGRIKWKLI